MTGKNHSLTLLLELAAQGNRQAADELFSIVYQEMVRLAGMQLAREQEAFTWQPTALVHEVWLKLIGGDESAGAWKNRQHFFAAAAQSMRRLLVDAARTRRRQKRGGARARVELRDSDAIWEHDDELLALDEALDQLRQVDSRKAQLVELRYFGGLTIAQTAEQLQISPATAERDWTFARAWLRAKMEQ